MLERLAGLAGFFFPSLRARGLGEEKPVPPYSAIIYKEGNEVRAEDQEKPFFTNTGHSTHLEPHEQLEIVYTSAPTMHKDVH